MFYDNTGLSSVVSRRYERKFVALSQVVSLVLGQPYNVVEITREDFFVKFGKPLP